MEKRLVRWRVVFSGRVQGVGFRFRTREIANELTVAGWVRNRSDGRVEMVAEADASRLQEFVSQVERCCGSVHDTEIHTADVNEEFSGFEIRF